MHTWQQALQSHAELAHTAALGEWVYQFLQHTRYRTCMMFHDKAVLSVRREGRDSLCNTKEIAVNSYMSSH